ncbi:hypothetical protein GCM10012320_10320 [Sinomonas cellulolyticus]|jgi:hypothetical protein|uniref:DUF2017 domain-containing protein n=1 Tax=Sinomonas cellulolyticus TaxID=2801916 RepID=A0ABS1K4U6_9MICC|nr:MULTISPECIES: DUF2017 domain-containing protein [Sinomonas]MBL0706488.1 DUF2017 domain-containing protein [Sinomonas cellulolyticus]GHG44893.1 hypothetical protein GCM10012320_10320 [Sinomonas sp. KCTC 49339]
MAEPFTYGRRGITGRLEDPERELLRGLFNDVVSMLDPGVATEDPLEALVGFNPHATEPEDPALARLLPNAYKGDAASSLDFRRLTERSLREGKAGALRAAALSLESSHLLLDDAAARHWSTALNDVRLVLAERLGIRSEEDAEKVHAVTDWAEAEDVDAYLALVYNFVTWLQTTLVDAMLDAHRVRSHGGGSGDE